MGTKIILNKITLDINIVFRFVVIFLLLSGLLTLASCKKLVTVDEPYTRTNAINVYTDDATAIAAVNGIYVKLVNGSINAFFGSAGIASCTGLSADELTLYSGVTDTKLLAYYKNALTGNAASSLGSEYWSPLYNYVYNCNATIEGLTATKVLTPSVKKQLLGEAKFMRAFFYFYLVNFFGEVPLAITAEYKTNALLSRALKEQIYLQAIADLKEAKESLDTSYLNGNLQKYTSIATAERVRPTKWAAAALLARVYLFHGDYMNADAESSLVIGQSGLYNLAALNDVFVMNSREAIWQLQPTKKSVNTDDATSFILTSTGPTTTTSRPVYLSDQMLNSFEAGDLRKVKGNWINSVTVSPGKNYYYPFKYKNNGATVTEYYMVLRLAEQYLIRAEAKAQQNKISDALVDINSIRTRARAVPTVAIPDPLPALLPALSKEDALKAILHERQTELFTEWGHRWFDLKRTNVIDTIMAVVTPLKANGEPWQSYQQSYPLPWSEILRAPNLRQNAGY